MCRFTFGVVTFIVALSVTRVQAITISGIVVNSSGSGIEGAVVRLGKAGLKTTSGSDGHFTITGTSIGHLEPAQQPVPNTGYPFELRNTMLFIPGAEPVVARASVYNCNGKLLFTQNRMTSDGDRLLLLPRMAGGILLYRVVINRTVYTFKTVTGIAMNILAVSSKSNNGSVYTAKMASPPDDALLFTKIGYQLSRCEVPSRDTSGIVVSLIPLDTGSVTDIDGNTYRTVRYGNRVWTVDNLYVTRYNDGENIPLAADSAAWSETDAPACCFYNYTTDPAERKKWGAFYNWYAVITGKLAPTGWHVATDEDWDSLQNFLIAAGYNYDGTTSENSIAKSLAVTTGWLSCPDSGTTGNDSIANNTSGFSGLPNGYCDYSGETYYRNWYAFWWTATAQDTTFVKIRGISYSSGDLKGTAFTKVYGLSVRLVRDR